MVRVGNRHSCTQHAQNLIGATQAPPLGGQRQPRASGRAGASGRVGQVFLSRTNNETKVFSQIVDLKRAGQWTMDAAKIHRELTVDKSPDIVITPKIKDFSTFVLKPDGNLGRVAKVVPTIANIVTTYAVDREVSRVVVHIIYTVEDKGQLLFDGWS